MNTKRAQETVSKEASENLYSNINRMMHALDMQPIRAEGELCVEPGGSIKPFVLSIDRRNHFDVLIV